MRYLILSDIHANWEALQAVLDAADGSGYGEIVCLGDIVGYGADPNACTDWVRNHVRIVVRGNHDKACVGLENLEWFNPAARASAEWTQPQLSQENREWLERLPRGPVMVNGFEICHGSPVDEDQYILLPAEAGQLDGYLDAPTCFFGHTHVQGGFRLHRTGVRNIQYMGVRKKISEYPLDDQSFFLLNPGSVGQPRDQDPRASWAIYEPEERLMIFHRTPYDIQTAQRKILAAGLPEILAYRLAIGR